VQTGVNGIAPSATSDAHLIDSIAQQWDRDRSDAAGDAAADFSDSADAETAGQGLAPGGRRLVRRPSKTRVNRVSRWSVQALPNIVRASSERIMWTRLKTRVSVSSPRELNVRVRQAGERAFGRVSHIHRSVCCRSPPCRRQGKHGLDSPAAHFRE
jgi:hypothetical protein